MHSCCFGTENVAAWNVRRSDLERVAAWQTGMATSPQLDENRIGTTGPQLMAEVFLWIMMKFRQVKIVDTRPDRIISSWREGAPNSSANRINHGAVRASSFCEVWQGGPSWGRGGASIGSPSHPPTASAIGGDVAGLQRPGVPDCRCHLSEWFAGKWFAIFSISYFPARLLDHTELFFGDLRFNLTGSERKKLLWKSP